MDLPDGVILLEGDIGSGKSTLLYAVEFALFGFSDMKGAHLLSEGRSDGHVTVVFETGGKLYTIERRLKTRKGDVFQDDCAISVDGTRTRLSPSDLKERVVSILGFNEPTHPRAESLVYRYAVFTPQEQMKEILTQNAEDRLHVVRRILGAQSYQAASENSTLVERRLGRMSYGLTRASEDLEDRRKELGDLSKEKASLEHAMPRLEADEKGADGAVGALETERRDLLSQRDALSRVVGRIEPLQEAVAELKKRLGDDESSRALLQSRLDEEILPPIARFESLQRPAQSAEDLQASKAELQRKLLDLKASKEALTRELDRTKGLLSQGVCPTCGQPLPRDFSVRSAHMGEEVRAMDEGIESLSVMDRFTDGELSKASEYESLEKDHSKHVKERSRAQAELESLAKRVEETRGKLKSQEDQLADANVRGGELKDLSRRIDSVEHDLERARSEKERRRDSLTRARAQLADISREAERLSGEVARKEKDVAEARRLVSYQDWLTGFFKPTVALIEKETLTQAAASFNVHFQRFFTSLVDDPDMLVRVREDFSPIFEREGYEQDYEALSGGERTSMALAYRFALNAVARDDLASPSELIVLDEPTDGFSKEQVYRVRGLLEELGSRQVVLVSHEKELESMADHIFRVEKKGGTSIVREVGP